MRSSQIFVEVKYSSINNLQKGNDEKYPKETQLVHV